MFNSEQALCSKCHQFQGEGGKIGPDLANLIHRDYDSVLRDIREPSAAINPDYITWTVTLTDGRSFVGTVRTDGDQLIIGDTTGKETKIAKKHVEAMTPSPKSTMPDDLLKKLSSEELRDLLTYLLTPPLQPATLEIPGAPPARSRAEVEAVLKAVEPSKAAKKKLRIVLSTGPKDHGPGEHDYPLWRRRWLNLLEHDDKVIVSEAEGWPTSGQWEKADLVVMFSANPGWTKDKVKDLDAFLERGGGLVLIHWAVNGRDAYDAYSKRVGLATKDGVRYRHGDLDLKFTNKKHPITAGFDHLKLVDESYWGMYGDEKGIEVLATSKEEGADHPQIWTKEQGKGRVYVNIPGHYTWTFDDPLARILILRGMAWAAHEPVDRFQPLVFEGARIQP